MEIPNILGSGYYKTRQMIHRYQVLKCSSTMYKNCIGEPKVLIINFITLLLISNSIVMFEIF